MRNRVLGVAGVAALIVALAGCGGAKPTSPPASESTQPNPKTPDPAITDVPLGAYELDPAKHVIPATPAAGRLAGKPFTPDRVELEGNKLLFRQGKDFFADLSIDLFLDKATKLQEGMKLVVKPSQKWTDDIPSLHTGVRGSQGVPGTSFVNDGYALTLEMSKPDKGKTQGKIFLALPDPEKSYLVGTFVAERKRSFSDPPGAEEVPYIQGSVSPPLTKGQSVTVGYLGIPTAGGNPVSDSAGGQAFGEGGGGGIRSTTFSPRTATLRFEKLTPKFDFTNLPPGRYLVHARVKEGPTAWSWVDVAAGASVTAEIKLDASKSGSVEVKVPPGEMDARLAPTDLGTPPPGDRFLDQLAYSLGLEADAKDGVATIKNVPAGNYQVRAGRLRGTVEVTAGKTATVELRPEKK